MARHTFLRTLALLLASSLCCVHARHIGEEALVPLDPKFVPLDPKDTKAVEVAEFAVDQHNKDKNATLKFVRVFQAAKSIVAPSVESYAVVIEVEDGGSTANKYDAFVQVINDIKKLVAFWKRR